MTRLQKFRIIQMPHLKVVPTKQVILHEYFDANRTTALKKKIITSGKWKDPPIVTQLIDGRFMVLDGANRTTSMKALGIPHMLAQVVDYFDPSIQLKSWNHVVRLLPERLMQSLRESGVDLPLDSHSDKKAKRMLSQRKILAYLCDRKGNAFVLPLQKSPKAALELLNTLVRGYEGKSVIHRTEEATHKAFHGLDRRMRTLIVFPSLTKLGVLNAIARGQFLPSGISRHLILRRALRIYLPLSVLKSRRMTIRQKQARADRLIQDLYEQGKVRFYPEGIYLFDE
ncbi:hypothetical protein A3I42_04870 [Candidatus Uhrbacteria bacterium RIFCSPLOWO2_02_FULL_49_11]|uniref:ParB/Sulfiredoxin domain-containing protein n=1 Tax=Candidatus Uhrbacteria bacterium RIFCSPLOWO2_02_FULL_49_11 TaxID=1802409 RepID=A0A1F7VBX5_9BACT|nr:MAG: hypothetical protein A3I42_04870 [Candidatus Uhrbacteria bacterium RIFCSPLOWO2_02_FULL_49_11]